MPVAARTKKRLVWMTAIALPAGAIALGVGACGGSASESPWPVEPDTPVLGPAGEDGAPQPLAPDGGAGADAAVGPPPTSNPGAPGTPPNVDP